MTGWKKVRKRMPIGDWLYAEYLLDKPYGVTMGIAIDGKIKTDDGMTYEWNGKSFFGGGTSIKYYRPLPKIPAT